MHTLMPQAFARKIVRLDRNSDIIAVENEARTVTKLCKPLGHANIISVLRHGYLQNKTYFFFDMELCQLNLDSYIKCKWTRDILEHAQHLTITDPFATRI